ncbi:MAG: acylphosphatase [Gammaproteobacteria bacterium]
MKKTIHCYISGRVQGVFFRARTREQAMLFGVTGWVRNLPDGRVEVMASGEEGPVRLLQEWLQRGPDHARVLNVEMNEMPYQDFASFSVR